jgi:hypothetical protein
VFEDIVTFALPDVKENVSGLTFAESSGVEYAFRLSYFTFEVSACTVFEIVMPFDD